MRLEVLWTIAAFIVTLLGAFVAYSSLAELAGRKARDESKPVPIDNLGIVSMGASAPGGRRWLLVLVICQLGMTGVIIETGRLVIS